MASDDAKEDHLAALTQLGQSGVTAPSELLERFPTPPFTSRVIMISDEVTAVCPVTGQPDQYTLEINYVPAKYCIESKSLKLKLQSFRNEGLFCEMLASRLRQHVVDSIQPIEVSVTVKQKPRGGVTIYATSSGD